jgi:hypothetical protein
MSVRLSKCAASEVAWRFRGAGPGGGDLKRMLKRLRRQVGQAVQPASAPRPSGPWPLAPGPRSPAPAPAPGPEVDWQEGVKWDYPSSCFGWTARSH